MSSALDFAGRHGGPLVFCLSLTAAGAGSLAAQPSTSTDDSGDVPTVTAQADAVTQRMPTELGLYVELVGRGRNAAQALDLLQSRREEVQRQLAALGVSRDSVRLGHASVRAASAENGLFPLEEEAAAQGSMMAVVPLTARWSLSAQEEHERLERAASLIAKITSALEVDAKDAGGTAPEVKDAGGLEPAAAPSPGKLNFFVVASLSEEQYEKLVSRALNVAQRQARQLATTAGRRLGDVVHLQRDDVDEADPDEVHDQTLFRLVLRKLERLETLRPEEAYSSMLGPVTFRVSVEASFRLGGQ